MVTIAWVMAGVVASWAGEDLKLTAIELYQGAIVRVSAGSVGVKARTA